MNFYKLSDSVNLDEVGVSGQVQKLMPGYYTAEQVESMNNIHPGRPIDFDFHPPGLKLEARAKRTDWLNTVHFSFASIMVITPRFENLLQDFSLPEFQTFPVSVFHKNEELLYKMIYLSEPMNGQLIDFENSSFVVTERNQFKKNILIHGWEHYLETAKIYTYPLGISFSKLVLNERANFYDIFRFWFLGHGIYISEKLKNAIQEAGLTGMEITPIEEIKHFYIPKS